MGSEYSLAAFVDPQRAISHKGAATGDRVPDGVPPAGGEQAFRRLQIDGIANELKSLADAADDLARFNHGAVEWLRDFARRLREQGVDAFANYIEDQAGQLAGARKIQSISKPRAHAMIETLRQLAVNAGAPAHDPILGFVASSGRQAAPSASAVPNMATPSNSADFESEKITSTTAAQRAPDDALDGKTAIAPGPLISTENDMFFFGGTQADDGAKLRGSVNAPDAPARATGGAR